MSGSQGRPVNVLVRNETWEELQLDALALDSESWNGEWFVPVRIEPRSVVTLRATDSSVGAAHNACDVTYLIAGDPDRPVYLHIQMDDDAEVPDVVEVWTPPICRARVGREIGSGSLEVEVSPVRRSRVA